MSQRRVRRALSGVLVFGGLLAPFGLWQDRIFALDALPSAQATLDLEWEAVEDADMYEVKLIPADGGEALQFQTSEGKFSQRLPVGVYRLQMRSRDKTSGYFGPWSKAQEIEVANKNVELLEPPDGAQLASPQDKKISVVFRWRPIAEATRYTLRIWADEPDKAREFSVSGSSKELILPTGKNYYWQVTFETDKASYRATPTTFSFGMLGPQLMTPVIDPKLTLPHVTKVSWSRSPGAEYYQVKILKRYIDEDQFETWKSLEKTEETSWGFEKLPPGGYRIEVIAHSSKRVSSEVGFHEFIVKPTEAELMAVLAPLGIQPEPPPAERPPESEKKEPSAEEESLSLDGAAESLDGTAESPVDSSSREVEMPTDELSEEELLKDEPVQKPDVPPPSNEETEENLDDI